MQIPVLVSDLDLECQLWLKIRLAPMTPYFGTVSLAFVGPPTIKVQLLPYNRVRLMQVPIVQVSIFCTAPTCISTVLINVYNAFAPPMNFPTLSLHCLCSRHSVYVWRHADLA